MTMLTVGVPQSLGKLTLLPPTVRRVRLGSSFLGAIGYADAPICDILELGEWDFIVCDEHNSIGAFADTGNTLGQAAEFSGIRFSPKFLVLWVDKKVPHL